MKENDPIGQTIAELAESEERKEPQHLYDRSPFLKLLGLKFRKTAEGIGLELDIDEKHANIYGIAHGAVLFALADTAMGWACYDKGMQVVTLDSSVNFIKPAPQGVKLYAVGKILHAGKKTVVTEGSIYDEAGNLYLKAQGTFFVLQPEVKA